VLQCSAVQCSALQYAAACCCLLQCVAATYVINSIEVLIAKHTLAVIPEAEEPQHLIVEFEESFAFVTRALTRVQTG